MKISGKWISCIFILFMLTSCSNGSDGNWVDNDKEIRISDDVDIITKIPVWTPQGGCLTDGSIYVVPYSSSFNDYLILRGYDSKNNEYLWEKFVPCNGHPNGCQYRSKDRRLYFAACYQEGTYSCNVFSIELDNIDKGIVETITAPMPDDKYLYSIAYDDSTDTFYGCGNVQSTDEEFVLYAFDGLFKDISNKVVLHDEKLRDCVRSMQGIQCVENGIAYAVYYSPEKMIVGFDIKSGDILQIYNIPNTYIDADNHIDVGELEQIEYDNNTKCYYLFTTDHIFECPCVGKNFTDDNKEVLVDLHHIASIPQRWALSGCYVENGLYIFCYGSTIADSYLFLCYDEISACFTWAKTIDSRGGFGNSIVYRPIDRRIYIADTYTNAISQSEIKNTISIIDYDEIDKGIIDRIESPAEGGIYSIAYDKLNDCFYSINYVGIKDGFTNKVYKYTGVFDAVDETVLIDDYTVHYSPSYIMRGISCVVDDVVWIPYGIPDSMIACYNLTNGAPVYAYQLPFRTRDFGDPETVIYNWDNGNFYLQTSSTFSKLNFGGK